MNKYRNKFEQDTGKFLEAQQVGFDYEAVKVKYTVPGTYLIDFSLNKKDGGMMHIETKGNGRSFDQHTRRKMIAVKTLYPELDLRILFYSNGKIGPKRKNGSFMRQSDWAKKHGFKYAIKAMPLEWFDELE